MTEVYIIAKQDRRRGGVRFTKGNNGPFKAEDFTKEQIAAIEADPYLEPSEGKKSSGTKSNSKKQGTGGRGGKSAAQKRAETKAKLEQEKTEAEIAKVAEAIKSLPTGVLPTVETVSKAMNADVTEEQLKAALEAGK